MPSKTVIPFFLATLGDGMVHPIVRMRIERRPILAVIDTGATRTTIDAGMAENLWPEKSWQQERHSTTGFGAEPLDNFYATAGELELGAYRFKNCLLAIIDLSRLLEQYRLSNNQETHAVLGNDILQACHAEISYLRMSLTLYKQGKSQ